MERTPLREEFFEQARRDPYLHAVTHYVAGAWVEGYEQALRELGTDDALRLRQTKSYSERFDDALVYLTEKEREQRAAALVAFAGLGRLAVDSRLFGG